MNNAQRGKKKPAAFESILEDLFVQQQHKRQERRGGKADQTRLRKEKREGGKVLFELVLGLGEKGIHSNGKKMDDGLVSFEMGLAKLKGKQYFPASCLSPSSIGQFHFLSPFLEAKCIRKKGGEATEEKVLGHVPFPPSILPLPPLPCSSFIFSVAISGSRDEPIGYWTRGRHSTIVEASPTPPPPFTVFIRFLQHLAPTPLV